MVAGMLPEGCMGVAGSLLENEKKFHLALLVLSLVVWDRDVLAGT